MVGTALVSFAAYQYQDYNTELTRGKGGKKRQETNDDARDSEFDAFLATWDKSYETDEEYAMRLDIFQDSLWQVNKMNKLSGNGDEALKIEINRFADWTDEEYAELLVSGTYIQSSSGYPPVGPPIPEHTPVEGLAASLDWRDEDVVGDVRDQWYDGTCASGYAMATVSALESAYAIANNLTTESVFDAATNTTADPTFVRLSVQQVASCSGDEGNMACDGGSHTWALDYIEANGVHTDEDYPYTGASDSCNSTVTDDATLDTVEATYYRTVALADANALEAEVASGPVAVAIAASSKWFRMYASGVLDKCDGDPDHAALLVGYGTTSETWPRDYWIVQNSWGTEWGEDGYVRIVKDSTANVTAADTNDDGIDDTWTYRLGECKILAWSARPVMEDPCVVDETSVDCACYNYTKTSEECQCAISTTSAGCLCAQDNTTYECGCATHVEGGGARADSADCICLDEGEDSRACACALNISSVDCQCGPNNEDFDTNECKCASGDATGCDCISETPTNDEETCVCNAAPTSEECVCYDPNSATCATFCGDAANVAADTCVCNANETCLCDRDGADSESCLCFDQTTETFDCQCFNSSADSCITYCGVSGDGAGSEDCLCLDDSTGFDCLCFNTSSSDCATYCADASRTTDELKECACKDEDPNAKTFACQCYGATATNPGDSCRAYCGLGGVGYGF